jgi:hypothetical protein
MGLFWRFLDNFRDVFAILKLGGGPAVRLKFYLINAWDDFSQF